MDEFRSLMLSGLVAMLVTLPITIRLIAKGKVVPKSEKLIREARAAGRVVTARLMKSRYSMGDSTSRKQMERQEVWFVVYQYEVDGRSYRFRSRMASPPPEELEMYYPAGRPDRAIPEGWESYGVSYMAVMLLPVAVWVILYWLVFQ